MKQISYEIRTRKGVAVFSYDSLHRAQEEARKAEKRIGVPMVIFRITRTEEQLEYA